MGVQPGWGGADDWGTRAKVERLLFTGSHLERFFFPSGFWSSGLWSGPREWLRMMGRGEFAKFPSF
jgi:hypothetical protein